MAVFVRAVLQNRWDGLDQFHQCVRNKQIFSYDICVVHVFYFIPPFLSNVSIMNLVMKAPFFSAHFQSWVPFLEYPRAINHLELYDCSPKLEDQGNMQG